MNEQAQSKVIYDVFTIHEYIHEKQVKSEWLRVGVGFQNRDGSFNLRLKALPLTDPKTGMANLHMRIHEDKPSREETDNSDDVLIDTGTDPSSLSLKEL